MAFIIKDWANNILFKGRQFKTFDDAWGFIYEQTPDHLLDTHEFDDYFVEEI